MSQPSLPGSVAASQVHVPQWLRAAAPLAIGDQLDRSQLDGFPALPRLAVQLLANRGIRGAEQISRFLHTPWRAASPVLPGIDRAVQRMLRARDRDELVVVYGDCDADGMTSCAILVRALRRIGVRRIEPYVPRREDDGRGLNAEAVEMLLGHGATLIVTTDCGTSNVDEVALAARHECDVVITDHHPPHGPVAEGAVALINPQAGGLETEDLALSGAGVAFRVAEALFTAALLEPDEVERALECLLDLAAVGTVGDVVSLTPRNWALVRAGLSRLRTAPQIGLRALFEEAHVPLEEVTEREISFVLAPRLNAAARMQQPEVSLRLLCTDDRDEAQKLADQLAALNRERQNLLEATMLEATQQLATTDALAAGPRADVPLVVRGDGWPLGIIGLVASRLVDQYHRPAIVISGQGETCRGSGRGPEGIDLGAALERRADLFIRFGGHKRAAGFTFKTALLDEVLAYLGEALPCAAQASASSQDAASTRFLDGHTLLVDAELPLERLDLNPDNLRALHELAPYGPDFPEPVFVCREMRLLWCWESGVNGQTLKLEAREEGEAAHRNRPQQRYRLNWPRHGALLGELREALRHPETLPLVDIAYSVGPGRGGVQPYSLRVCGMALSAAPGATSAE